MENEEYFKPKSENGEHGDEANQTENEENNALNARTAEFVKELLAEKLTIDQHKCPNAIRLLDQELKQTHTLGRVPVREHKYVDVYREKPIKIVVKVLVPVREHPRFNFVGKLLGPKGNSLKRLQEETMCKMAILGRGSMKDRAKEEELRQSLDPKYSHLTEDLHVEISALGPPAEAHARVAFALAEVRKYLVPDSNDNIRQEQMREMDIMDARPGEPGGPPVNRPPLRRSMPPQGGSILRSVGGPPRGPVPARPAPRPPVSTPRVMPAKTKIMSILDRARIAMEESYGLGNEYDEYSPTPPVQSSYDYSTKGSVGGGGYSGRDYDDYEDYGYGGRSGPTGGYDTPTPTSSWKTGSAPGTPALQRRPETARYKSSPYTRRPK